LPDTTRPTMTCPGDVRVYTTADQTTVDLPSPLVYYDHIRIDKQTFINVINAS